MSNSISPGRVGLPPPAKWDLMDADHVVGWTTENAVGFRGFADETEAVHAAWVAHRTLARRLARTHGTRPVPVDTEPLALQRRGGQEMILASGHPIAVLVRPGADSPTGPDSFGFEVVIPSPVTELEIRGLAYLIYRTLRKSGLHWALWRPRNVLASGAQVAYDRSEPAPDRTANSNEGSMVGDGFAPFRARTTREPSPTAFVAKIMFAAIAIVVVATMLATAPATVTVPMAVVLGTGLAASTLVVAVGRRRLARRYHGHANGRLAPPPAPGCRHDLTASEGSDRDAPLPAVPEETSEAVGALGVWGALGVMSVSLLVLALVVGERLGAVLAVSGLAGLAVFRLAATYGGWLRRGSI